MSAMSLPFSPKNLLLTYAVSPGPIKNERTFFNLASNVFDTSFWSTLRSEIGLQLEKNRLSLFDFSISLIMACLLILLIYENIFNFTPESAVEFFR